MPDKLFFYHPFNSRKWTSSNECCKIHADFLLSGKELGYLAVCGKVGLSICMEEWVNGIREC